jgi:putative xylitol transport system permease protein
MSVTAAIRHSHLQAAIAKYGIIISFVALIIILSLANPYFLTEPNLLNVLRQVSINGLLAVGMTYVILAGGIDLSVGSVLAFSGLVAARLVTGSEPAPTTLAISAAIIVGAGFGMINGSLIAAVGIPPFVATLGMLSAARGATLLFSNGRPIASLSYEFRQLGQGSFFNLPLPALIFAVVAIAAWTILGFSVFGRHLYAVGGNVRSARTSGVATGRIIFSVYVIMGALAGLAGAVLTARTSAAVPQAGLGYELDAIAAVVIGGTSLTGGVGKIAYTIIGVLIIGTINNGLDLLGVSSYYQQIVKGTIIVVAVVIDKSRHQTS